MPYKDLATRRRYQAEWIQARRKAWFAANGPCRECGSPNSLELDHIDKTQKVTHRIWSFGKEKFEAEVAKCQVLCRWCHLAKTLSERTDRTTHGKLHMYRAYGCRCELCVAAKRASYKIGGPPGICTQLTSCLQGK